MRTLSRAWRMGAFTLRTGRWGLGRRQEAPQGCSRWDDCGAQFFRLHPPSLLPVPPSLIPQLYLGKLWLVDCQILCEQNWLEASFSVHPPSQTIWTTSPPTGKLGCGTFSSCQKTVSRAWSAPVSLQGC